MHCPLCNKGLQTLHHGEVELDRCTGCGAVWFDAGELAEVLGIERSVEAGVRLAPTADEQVRLPCPRCADELREVEVTDVRGAAYAHAAESVWVCRGCKGAVLSRKALRRAQTEGLRGGDIPSDNPDRAARRMESVIEVLSDVLIWLPW